MPSNRIDNLFKSETYQTNFQKFRTEIKESDDREIFANILIASNRALIYSLLKTYIELEAEIKTINTQVEKFRKDLKKLIEFNKGVEKRIAENIRNAIKLSMVDKGKIH